MELKVINNGEYDNDPTADLLKDAFDKVNHNFKTIGDNLNIEFDTVVWKDQKDTKPAFDTINKNFGKI